MFSTVRSRALSSLPWKLPLGFLRSSFSFASSSASNLGLLELGEVEKVLGDVKAEDVRVIPVRDQCDWTDYMVIATGRSTWHVRNIAQALIHKAGSISSSLVKQKQQGSERLLLPSVEGHAGGKWIVIDSGTVIVHALDEKARAYYNLESLWTKEMSPKSQNQDLEKSIVKTRRRDKSEKPMKSI
ncbi:Protein Iojap-related, mitochondrial [Ananas comosus]|uniref:Protein Iojap-related, mitochondrial n=1 Tax=Ananas comosus TaxID=4615 RepID=A0A199V4C3_ANACO|nr:Protein Iojap-related, mitochondrial [Ananas comosus]